MSNPSLFVYSSLFNPFRSLLLRHEACQVRKMVIMVTVHLAPLFLVNLRTCCTYSLNSCVTHCKSLDVLLLSFNMRADLVW